MIRSAQPCSGCGRLPSVGDYPHAGWTMECAECGRETRLRATLNEARSEWDRLYGAPGEPGLFSAEPKP